MTARARLVEVPTDGPSVEDHLMDIRRALALATMFAAGASLLDAQDHPFDDDLASEARSAVESLCEQAWSRARELAQALPARIQNMRVMVDEEGGAR